MKQNKDKTHHAQVLPVVVLANNVPQAVEGGTGVLVDGDLYVRCGRLVLAYAKKEKVFTSVMTELTLFLNHHKASKMYTRLQGSLYAT